jgi:large subunit ribosomal protein L6
MKKDLKQEIEIPAGIEAEIESGVIKIKKGKNEVARKFNGISARKEGNNIIISAESATKKEKKLINTISAHVRNMINGLEKNYIYKLQICSVHFPMNVSVDKAKNELIIKNYLGEKHPRKAKILDNVSAKVDKDIIILESFDKEAAGQTAGNIERATHLNMRDRRRFQDGIWITEKAEVMM